MRSLQRYRQFHAWLIHIYNFCHASSCILAKELHLLHLTVHIRLISYNRGNTGQHMQLHQSQQTVSNFVSPCSITLQLPSSIGYMPAPKHAL